MHPTTATTPSPADLDLLDRVARSLARSRKLTPADVDDFAQTVQLRMAERHYDVFALFEARASLRTYLTVVVARLLKDWQNHQLGKWRPSAAARRLGPVAVTLDREVNRDGTPVDEATRMVASRAGRSEAELTGLMAHLPRRPKRRIVPLDPLRVPETAFVDPIVEDLQRRATRQARRALLRALAQMCPTDARLFVSRYLKNHTVARLAKAERVDAKVLYRRFDRIRRTLRECVIAQGVSGPDCVEA